MTLSHIAFPSLEQFDDVQHRMTYNGQAGAGSWGSKIKLHGMNMSIVVESDGSVRAQSRYVPLDAGDTSGFHAFVQSTLANWARVAAEPMGFWPVTFFGEWAGPGLQRGTSVSGIPHKAFFLFALGLGTMPHPQNPDITLPQWMVTDPDAIADVLASTGLLAPAVHVLPWAHGYTFNFADPEALATELDRLNQDVDALEKNDPFVAQVFGVEGPGEGYVLTHFSSGPGALDGATYGRFSFKAKTVAHRVRKQSKPATPKAPPPATLPAFIDTYVTPARCAQGLAEACGGVVAKTSIGPFVAWMKADVVKEAARDMEAMGLTPAVVEPAVAAAARAWLLPQCP
jgi:RNA ligase